MKIALDASVLELPPTGIAKVTAGLAHACLARDTQLSIDAFHQRPLRMTIPGRITGYSPARWIPQPYWRTIVLPRVMRNADVAWFPWNGDVPRLRTNGIVASTIHDVLPLIIPGYFHSAREEEQYRRRTQFTLDRSDVVLTDSEYSRRQIVSQFRAPRDPVVIAFGPTMTLPEAGSHDPETTPYFVYVGGYDRRKGIEKLVATFVGLHNEGRVKSRLILTGTPNYFSDTLRDQITTGTARGAVEERGYVDEPTLSRLLRHALALIYPSKYEGFGLPPLEAMTAGCPVITTQETSIPEVCGEAAVYIDPDDHAAFGNAIVSLEQDAQLRERLREAGYRQASRFTWDRAATQFLGALTSALAVRRGA